MSALVAALCFTLLALVQGLEVSHCHHGWSHRKAIACNRQRSSDSAGRSFFEQGTFLLCGSASVLACVFLCPCFQKRKDAKPEQLKERPPTPPSGAASREARTPSALLSESGPSAMSIGSGALTFTMAELNRITGNFSNSQRVGNTRSTYKGTLRDGTVVAVKRCKKEAHETRQSEFQNEVNMLSNVEHMNLVKLVGYLEDDRERIHVVEYVPNGTLRDHLDGAHNVVLDFSTRLDIATDVAHALTYLHLYAEQPIIHRDVKASNILLTERFRAKVADFGFSRAGPSDVGATHISTQVKGTAGYLDPEYLQTYQLTPKSDVHSFGVLLIEIFSARRPIELFRPSDERITIRWAFKKFIEGKIEEILDPKIRKSPSITGVLERLAEVAFQCAAPTRKDRPTMKEAGEVLWNIRKDYQSSLSHSPTPRTSSFDPSSVANHPLFRPDKNSPLPSPLQRNSPIHSPGLRSPR